MRSLCSAVAFEARFDQHGPDPCLEERIRRAGSPHGRRSGHGELLNALIARIADVKIALAVKGHPVRARELTGPLARAADAEEELAVAGETLDAVIQTADPDAVMFVDSNADRTEGIFGVAE